MVRDIWFRKWSAHCVDCGVDVHLAGEYYMVRSGVWNSAWLGRYRSPIGDGQLCIGCLERRLGRTLMSCDFTDAPVNTERSLRSDLLCDRLAAKDWLYQRGCIMEQLLGFLPLTLPRTGDAQAFDITHVF